MGVVRKQSIQNTVVQYLGVVLGYFNSVILFTNFLDTEQFGLTRILYALATIYVSFSSLGTFKIFVRFFPHFKGRDTSHNGFLTFNILLSLAGFIIATVLYIVLKGPIENYSHDTELFTENYYYVILLSFVMLYANLLESFLMAMKRTVLPHFLRNIGLRLIWMGEILLYHYDWISFDVFIFLYVTSFFFNFLVMLGQLIYLKEFKLSFKFFNTKPRVFKVIISYGLFSIVSGISSMMVNRIDIVMITFLLGLSSNSVYAIASYISSVLMVPSQAMYRISMPVVAEQWKKKDIAGMLDLYRKSSLNQLLFGCFVFLCIWINIDDIFKVLPSQYLDGKWVVFILGISILVALSTGMNHVIVMVSRFYRYDSLASVALAIITIITNYLFIPIWGIEGAAFATLLSVFLFYCYKFILVYQKLDMQPFTKETLIGVLLSIGTYFAVYFIPEFPGYFMIRILMKCILAGLIFVALLWWTGIAEDIRKEILKVLQLLKIKN